MILIYNVLAHSACALLENTEISSRRSTLTCFFFSTPGARMNTRREVYHESLDRRALDANVEYQHAYNTCTGTST